MRRRRRVLPGGTVLLAGSVRSGELGAQTSTAGWRPAGRQPACCTMLPCSRLHAGLIGSPACRWTRTCLLSLGVFQHTQLRGAAQVCARQSLSKTAECHAPSPLRPQCKAAGDACGAYAECCGYCDRADDTCKEVGVCVGMVGLGVGGARRQWRGGPAKLELKVVGLPRSREPASSRFTAPDCAPLVRHNLCATPSGAVNQPLAPPSTCPLSSVPAVPRPRRGVHGQHAVLCGSWLLLLHQRQVQPVTAAACGAGRAWLPSSCRAALLSRDAATQPAPGHRALLSLRAGLLLFLHTCPWTRRGLGPCNATPYTLKAALPAELPGCSQALALQRMVSVLQSVQ